MSFFNWNLVTPTLPTLYTYILQPSFMPIALQLPSPQPPIVQLTEIKNYETRTQSKEQIVKCTNPNLPVTQVKQERLEEKDTFDTETKSLIVKEEPINWEKKEAENEFEAPLNHQNNILVKEEVEDEIKHESEGTDEKKIHVEQASGHLKTSKSTKRVKSFSCDHCSYTTNWKGNLTKHIVSRHTALEEIKWLKCDHCSYKGKTKDYLKCHLLHVHNISVKWFNCSQCSFKAKLKSLLDRHTIVNHTEIEQIQWLQCAHCSYKAKFKTNLKQHLLSKHTESSDINWFRCDYCSFKAKRKRNLKFHQLNKHTDYDKIQWLKCEFCAYKFKRKPALKLHLASVHNNSDQKKSKPKTREIPVFIDNKLCWRRVVVPSASPEDFAFKCGQCDVKMADKEMFKKHVLKEHTVTETKEEDDCIVKKTYKTKDVIVLVDDRPCVKKVVDHVMYK